MKPIGALLSVLFSGLAGFGAATFSVAPTGDDGTAVPQIASSDPASDPASGETNEENEPTEPETEPSNPNSPHADILGHAQPGSVEPLTLFQKRVQQQGGGTYQTERLLRKMYKENLASSLAFLEGIADPDLRKEYTRLMLYDPPVHDVPALLKWMKQQGDPDFRAEVLSLVMKQWTKRDQATALAAIKALPEENRSALYAKMMKDLPAHNQLETLPKIPEADRESFFITHAKKLSKRLPEEALARMLELRPSEGRDSAMTDLVRKWATRDPLRAIQSVQAQNDPNLEAQGFREVAHGWSSVDSYRASEWINELKPGPARDAASSGLAEEMTSEQPDRAFEWAASIRDPGLRVETLRQVMEQWRTTDSAAAAAALSASQLTQEEQSALAPQPKVVTP